MSTLKLLVDKTWQAIKERKFKLDPQTGVAVKRYLAYAVSVDEAHLKRLKGDQFRQKLIAEVAAKLGDGAHNELTRRGYVLAQRALEATHADLEGDKSLEQQLDKTVEEIRRRLSDSRVPNPTLYQEVAEAYLKWYKLLRPLNLFGQKGKPIGRPDAANAIAWEELHGKHTPHERLQIQVILTILTSTAKTCQEP